MDLYIYYKVRDADAAVLAPRVRAVQAALALAHGVQGRLMRRPATLDSMQTWMEVYAAVPPHFEAALASALAGSDIAASIAGARHLEVFTEIEPCA